ncbi:hypothetical protein BDZ89DRAFT_1154863 [Hymenopellis radicata]|nr:hypothetical protein BDZ89DRAFT_1154863 [Hymenopellis radicata]
MHSQRKPHSPWRKAHPHFARDTPALPPELCDMIIDFNHAARKTLARCSLVCRSWIPASRYHMWTAIRLTPTNLDTFLSLISSNQSTFLPYVKTFEIENAFKKIKYYHKFWNGWDSIASYLSDLPRLRSFTLSKVSWGLLDDMKWSSSVLYTFASVTNLGLSNVSFHDTPQLLAFLCNFPHLRHLTVAICFSFIDEGLFQDEEGAMSDFLLGHDDVEDHETSPLVVPYPLSGWPSLHSCHFTQGQLFDVFGLHVSSRQEMFAWMASFTPALCIRDLSLYSLTTPELESCGILLSSIGRTIEKLSISFLTHFLPSLEVARHVNISSLSSLTTLHVRQIGQEACDCTKLSTIFLLLSQIRSRNMKSLVFTLSVDVLEGLQDEHWATFQRCLTLPHFADVEEITFNMHYATASPSEKYFRSKFPESHGRCILRFDFLQTHY